MFQAIRELGGSGTIGRNRCKDDENIEIDAPSAGSDGGSSKTEVEYRLAWARTYMKKAGVLENSSRGVLGR